MDDKPSDDPGDDDTGLEPDGESTTGTPRWVYAFGFVVIVLLVLFVVLHLAGHGLGGHG